MLNILCQLMVTRFSYNALCSNMPYIRLHYAVHNFHDRKFCPVTPINTGSHVLYSLLEGHQFFNIPADQYGKDAGDEAYNLSKKTRTSDH